MSFVSVTVMIDFPLSIHSLDYNDAISDVGREALSDAQTQTGKEM